MGTVCARSDLNGYCVCYDCSKWVLRVLGLL
jgi:hypothetical protein